MDINLRYVVPLAACCLYAWRYGGAPERIAGAIILIGSALTHFAANGPPFRFRLVEWGILAVDIACFLAFLALSLRADRFWTLWVTALAGLGIAGHFARQLSPQMVPWAYWFVLSIWSYPILALIATGTWRHRRRVRTNGADSSWSSCSSRPGRTRREAAPGG